MQSNNATPHIRITVDVNLSVMFIYIFKNNNEEIGKDERLF
uniref:Uncharacterized protein n=1 Tax=Meloidogyne enterolobii TaxID=390850 RepID=A0A6V7W5T8_MELEN|nr:unnamed protein product [Meloidogyne enterolobii]